MEKVLKKARKRVQFLSDLARRTLDCRAEKIPEMLEHKRNAFMLMDKLIVHDKPSDTDRRGTGMFLIMQTLLIPMQMETPR